MSDKIAITAGVGTDVNTDDCGAAGHVQGMKLCYSADGVATYITADSTGLYVRQNQSAFRIAPVDSAGVTTASTNYAIGDQVGTEFVFASAALTSGWGGWITDAILVDKSLKLNAGDFELLLFRQSVTPAADNAAHAFSDADKAHYLGKIRFATGDWETDANSAINERHQIGLGYTCNATSLFGYAVTKQANAFFSASTDFSIGLILARD